ncbi:hypothetical protein BH09VER1_BH09VER1_10700 [soil metagenome]
MKVLLRLLLLLALVGTAQADNTIASAQRTLKQLGYYNGTVDGEPGSQTAAALRRYQLAMNLKVDGQLNNQTLKSLNVVSAPALAQTKPLPLPAKVAPTPKPKPTPKPTPAPRVSPPAARPMPEYVAIADIFKGGPYISAPPEIQFATVRQAQKNLKTLGYYHGPINSTPSQPLVIAIKAWQQSAGFRQTGRFDESTLKGLSLMPN